jgi:hypothetical protein
MMIRLAFIYGARKGMEHVVPSPHALRFSISIASRTRFIPASKWPLKTNRVRTTCGQKFNVRLNLATGLLPESTFLLKKKKGPRR